MDSFSDASVNLSNFLGSVQHEAICLTRHQQNSLLAAARQGEKAMKLPRNTLFWCVLVICITLLIFTYLTRKTLCEIRYKDAGREVAALMAYESAK